MNKLKSNILNVLIITACWWLALTGYAYYRVRVAGVVPDFPYYNILLRLTDREHAVWSHFDGIHYLRLAQDGYRDVGTQAFFPVYPLIIQYIHAFSRISYPAVARGISLITLSLSLLCMIYVSEKKPWHNILILLIFPTSFYLATTYTESLFLLETLIFFLCLKKRWWLLAASIAGLASATRLAGSLLVVSLYLGLLPELKTKKQLYLILPLAISGLLMYMFYLWIKFGDPLMFVHVQSMFATGRTNGQIILLPQVLYRYLRIFATVPLSSSLGMRAVFEFLTFICSAIWLIKKWHILPRAQWYYVVLSLLLPTLSGTLSSLPRYVLVLVPFMGIESVPLRKMWPYLLVSAFLLIFWFTQFIHGSFVADWLSTTIYV